MYEDLKKLKKNFKIAGGTIIGIGILLMFANFSGTGFGILSLGLILFFVGMARTQKEVDELIKKESDLKKDNILNTENLLKNKWTWIIGGVVLLIIASGGEEQSIPITTQPQVKNIQQEIQVKELTFESRSLGKWFGKRSVYLAKQGSKYVATFDPPLPIESLSLPTTASDPIYPYLVGLLNEVWGIFPSQLSNPQIASPLLFYKDYAGGKFSFLVLKEETTGAISGVSFWKE